MSKKLQIFATENLPGQIFKNLQEQGHKIEVWQRSEKGTITNNDIKERATDCDVLITMLSNQIDAQLLESLPKLKLICQYAVGYNNIDLEKARKLDIEVTNTPNVLTEATAELALALMLCSARKIEAARNNVVNNEWLTWEPCGFIGKSLFNLKHGIIGAGRIGTQFAKMCKGAFNQEIIYTGPNRKESIEKEVNATYVELATLLKESDIISIHCPYNTSTHELLNDFEFKQMKKDVLLINTARGEIINEKAMYNFFKENTQASAGLDVVCNEPLSVDSPLRTLSNIFILPHIGSANNKARQDMADLIYANIDCYSRGEELKSPI